MSRRSSSTDGAGWGELIVTIIIVAILIAIATWLYSCVNNSARDRCVANGGHIEVVHGGSRGWVCIGENGSR